MAHYYFHLRDGVDVLLDEEGRDLPNPPAIKLAALTEARGMISSDALEGRIRLDLRIDVEDSEHAIIYTLAFKDAVDIVQPHEANDRPE